MALAATCYTPGLQWIEKLKLASSFMQQFHVAFNFELALMCVREKTWNSGA